MRLSTWPQCILRRRPRYGARFHHVLDSQHVRLGRQTELDSLCRHRVVKDVSNGLESVRVQADWTDDCKKYPLSWCRFIAQQLAYGARDEVTRCRTALLVFWLMIEMCEVGLLGKES